MPAKRVIIGDRTPNGGYNYILWADVPASNQPAYRDPNKPTAYVNANPAEMQAIRDGLVAEKTGTYSSPSDSLATMQTNLQSFWTGFQAEITAEAAWTNFGRHWDGASWIASPGVPWATPDTENGLPTFIALSPVSAFAANKFHLVIFNNAATATSQSLLVKIRMIVILPGQAGLTGVAPSVFQLRRRESPTTAPAGGVFSASPLDSAHILPNTITLHAAPTTAPAGGTLHAFNEFVPQADEQKLTTLDGATMASLNNWGGLTIYKASDVPSARPIVLRANQTLEVQQSATGGTGNCRVLCIFTVG